MDVKALAVQVHLRNEELANSIHRKTSSICRVSGETPRYYNMHIGPCFTGTWLVARTERGNEQYLRG